MNLEDHAMRLHKPTRPFAPSSDSLDLQRQVSAAVAEYRTSAVTDQMSAPTHRLQAQVVPLDAHGTIGSASRIEVKSFDERSITFQHSQPLHDRRALVVLEGLNLGRIAAEVDLSWCRFSRGGSYLSGGRFVHTSGRSA
jgi:hypothetical protein